MKLFLYNTPHGLKPMYDDDFEEKKKLKLNTVYQAEIKQARNYEFHQKYFALINRVWEYQPERVQKHFKTVKGFRKTVEIAAGWYEPVYSLSRQEWIEEAKSIAFDKMTQSEFDQHYSNVLEVLTSTFLKHISEAEFKQNIEPFYY